MEPKSCPVCGDTSIKPILRTAIEKIQAEQQVIAGVMAYRCSRAHVFLIPEQHSQSKAAKNDRS
jgi:hypothetical protein